ncbi:hypothetical protein CLU96_1338 [Chryseobacterium sp. 52]|uniref:GIY-YIG nuclease family protein n=1 Tax=Chryseobacterium sp. 52 TaxID=2035213 RepID=UPI000C194BA2|nr:GIY-YIG nuclease family protein [Chryseobacterium sp. 52]PIF44373.1 hypothetical protein CLU96_1338 [Chryseobacterium sp. 52]
MKNTLRQQLREKAKNHPVTMGVLSVTNRVNEKRYIQGSLHLEALVNKMKFSLNTGQFSNISFQNDWTEYGSEAFTFEFVAIVLPQETPYINYRQEITQAEKTVISECDSLLY